MAFGGGWFFRDGSGAIKPVIPFVWILDCDREGASYMLPLGVIHASGRSFWVSQQSGWNQEHYEVAEIHPNVKSVLKTWGGGC